MCFWVYLWWNLITDFGNGLLPISKPSNYLSHWWPQWYHMESLSYTELTHCGLVMLNGIRHLGQHWFRLWLVTGSVPSHYLNHCWLTDNIPIRNKFQQSWNNVNAFENVVCNMVAILLGLQWVNEGSLHKQANPSPIWATTSLARASGASGNAAVHAGYIRLHAGTVWLTPIGAWGTQRAWGARRHWNMQCKRATACKNKNKNTNKT